MSSEGMITTRLQAHQRWEYHLLSLNVAGFFGPDIDLDTLNNRLNELGAQGWEVVGMTTISTGQGQTREVLYTLKRLVH